MSKFGFKGYEIPFESKIIGSGSEFVNVVYKVKYLDSDGDLVIKINEVNVAITNCGRPWPGI